MDGNGCDGCSQVAGWGDESKKGTESVPDDVPEEVVVGMQERGQARCLGCRGGRSNRREASIQLRGSSRYFGKAFETL